MRLARVFATCAGAQPMFSRKKPLLIKTLIARGTSVHTTGPAEWKAKIAGIPVVTA